MHAILVQGLGAMHELLAGLCVGAWNHIIIAVDFWSTNEVLETNHMVKIKVYLHVTQTSITNWYNLKRQLVGPHRGSGYEPGRRWISVFLTNPGPGPGAEKNTTPERPRPQSRPRYFEKKSSPGSWQRPQPRKKCQTRAGDWKIR